jgi:hypothetical protein
MQAVDGDDEHNARIVEGHSSTDDTTHDTYYSQRTFAGGNTFTIPLDATWPR